MLRVEGVCIRYHGSSADVVEGVSISIPKGTALGLVGESGSGKSTLARAIVGLTPSRTGVIEVDQVDVTNARRDALRHLRANVQMVFQDPNASLHPRMTVGRTLGEAVRVGTASPRTRMVRPSIRTASDPLIRFRNRAGA